MVTLLQYYDWEVGFCKYVAFTTIKIFQFVNLNYAVCHLIIIYLFIYLEYDS